MAGKNGSTSSAVEDTARTTVPSDVLRLIKGVRRRLWVTRLLAGLHDSLFVVVVVLLVYALADKAFPSVPRGFPFLTWFSLGLAVFWLGGALVLSRFGRLSDGAIAALIDERLELKDRFTTAIHCAHRDDPFARAALEEAVSAVSQDGARQAVYRRFTPRMPTGSFLIPVLGLLVMIIYVAVPYGDLLKSENTIDDSRALEERFDNEQTVQAVLETIKENEALSDEMAALGQSLELEDALAGKSESPEAQRREALRRISDLERQLDDLVNGEQGKSMESFKRSMESLSPSPDGKTKPLIDALKSSDFGEAMKELEKLQAKANDPSLTDEQREKLASDLEDLAKQLAEAAEDREALEEALQRAGMDPALAGDAQALEQAMKQASGLNQQQMQQLKQMMNAQKSSAQQCQNMSQSLDKMAQECKNGGQGQQGMDGAQQMLSQAEMTQQMLQAAKSAKSQCEGGNGGKPGAGMAGILPSQSKPMPKKSGPAGTGFGPQGNGGAGEAPLEETRFSTKYQKENVAVREGGDVISRQLVESKQPLVGESSVELKQIADRIVRSWEEGVQDEPVPSHLRDVHKHYFGELKKRIDAKRREAPATATPAPASAEAPAETTSESTATPEASETSKSE